jgi:polysaccharide pyruvyl transferase CsaB
MVVGLSGYYGFQNAGDEALLEAIVQQLHARGHKPLVFSASPKEHTARYSVKAVRRMHLLELWRALGEVDLLISGGGTLLQDKTSAISLLYYLSLISLAKRRGKRVYVFNQSLGPLSKRGEGWVKRTLKGVPIFLRDRASLEYATRLGLEAELGADCALVLAAPPVEREESMVVLVPREGTEAANQTLRRVGERLRSSGHEVVVLGMQPGYDDEVMEIFHGFTTEMAWDPRRVSYLLAQAGYVVSVRLHGCILAAAAGTSYAGISYDPKVAGFCADSGAPYQDAPGTPEFFVQAVESRIQPDWEAVGAMRERARHTFDRVLSRLTMPVRR